MVKMKCKCGEIISDSLVPNDTVMHFFTDKQLHQILYEDLISTIALAKTANKLWSCERCERLYFFGDNNEDMKVYALESVSR